MQGLLIIHYNGGGIILSRTKRADKDKSAFSKIRKFVPMGDIPFKDRVRYERRDFKKETQTIIDNINDEDIDEGEINE